MQKKYLKYICLFAILFIININVSYAMSYRAKITGTGVYLRQGPGTNYSSVKTLVKNAEYNMVSDKLYKDEKGCSGGWYKIYYEASASGYVCSKYVEKKELVYNVNPTTNCEKEFSIAGFPATYWPGLCELKNKYPNWDFKAVLTGLDWSTAVNKESECGTSYIENSDPSNIDKSCKNPYSKSWYPASSTAVAYYMDPRNWLNEKYIFQFEHLSYNDKLTNAYKPAAIDVIDHAAFYKYHVELNHDFGAALVNAGKKSKVSPVFIASRVLQELGAKTSEYNLYSGVYPGYEDYYNFYNYGVSDTCATGKSPTECGLSYAKNHNWKGLENALKGGADSIYSSYIQAGQYSGYLQKYNVVPNNGNVYSHQYMTNIQAPSSEAKSTYNSYSKLGLLSNSFVFYIPVYNNMDNSNYTVNSGAVSTPDSTDPSKLAISTIIVSSGYKYSSGYISGINADTSIKSVKNTIESIAGANSVTIKNADGNAVSDGAIGTGYKITVKNAETNETLTVVIHGDTSGDGKINALDLLQVQKNIAGIYSLSGAKSLAGDTSGDGKINALDLLQVQKSIAGITSISQ